MTSQCKIVVCGPSQAGKTDYIQDLIAGRVSKASLSEGVEIDSVCFRFSKYGSKELHFNCWDLSEGRFTHPVGKYFKDAQGILLVVRSGDQAGFRGWYTQISELGVPIYVLISKTQMITTGEIEDLCLRHQLPYSYLKQYELCSKNLAPFGYFARKVLGDDGWVLSGIPSE